MSLRLPQSIGSSSASDRAMDAFNHELLAERAASLGRAGRTLSDKLAMLRAASAGVDRSALLKDAARAAHGYFIQRELCGLFSHQAVIDDLAIPKEVLAKVGAL